METFFKLAVTLGVAGFLALILTDYARREPDKKQAAYGVGFALFIVIAAVVLLAGGD